MFGQMGGNSADKGFNPSSALVKAVLINSAKPTATLLDSYGEPFPLSAVHTNVPDNCQVLQAICHCSLCPFLTWRLLFVQGWGRVAPTDSLYLPQGYGPSANRLFVKVSATLMTSVM